MAKPTTIKGHLLYLDSFNFSQSKKASLTEKLFVYIIFPESIFFGSLIY